MNFGLTYGSFKKYQTIFDSWNCSSAWPTATDQTSNVCCLPASGELAAKEESSLQLMLLGKFNEIWTSIMDFLRKLPINVRQKHQTIFDSYSCSSAWPTAKDQTSNQDFSQRVLLTGFRRIGGKRREQHTSIQLILLGKLRFSLIDYKMLALPL